MKQEQALKLADEALRELAESLQNGRSRQLKEFLEVMARFPKYSLRNVMLIMAQRPDSTHVAGFHTWKALGRRVSKGEKGIGIVAPLVRRSQIDTQEQAGRFDDDSLKSPVRGFRVVHVFDVAQTEGDDIPELTRPQGEPGDTLARLEAVVRGRGLELEYQSLPDGTQGFCSNGKIVIHQGLDPADTFAVLAHELAHGIMHHSTIQPPSPKHVRETEAEAVAHVICHAIGIDSRTSSADYIQLYDGDLTALNGSLQAIQTTAAQILLELSRAESHTCTTQAHMAAA